MQDTTGDHPCRTNSPWNRGKLIRPKPPLKPKEIWSIRVRLQVANCTRDLALFNLALDSKLRACDLVGSRRRTCIRASHSFQAESIKRGP